MLATDVAFERIPPVARILIVGTLIAFVAVEVVVGRLAGDRSSPLQSSPQDRGSYQVILATTFTGILLAVEGLRRLPGSHLPGGVWLWAAVGLLVAWVGILLRG